MLGFSNTKHTNNGPVRLLIIARKKIVNFTN